MGSTECNVGLSQRNARRVVAAKTAATELDWYTWYSCAALGHWQGWDYCSGDEAC